MIRITAVSLALATLAACGAGGSEFATKATAACIKEEGQAASAKCACQARLVEQALNDKEKKFVLATIDTDSMDQEAAMKALADSGLTIADMMSMGQRMAAIEERVTSECKA